jgi:histidine triad (HIT) family protein
MMRDGCVFCDYAGPSEVLADSGPAFIIRPLNPVAVGHVLAVAREHVTDAVADPLVFGQVAEQAAAYARVYRLGPCNLITSVGRAASQTIRHLHVHIVPRQHGDGISLPWSG